MSNRLSRFSQSFKNNFEEALIESIVVPIQETFDEIYSEKERELEDVADISEFKPRTDISAEKVFIKMKKV